MANLLSNLLVNVDTNPETKNPVANYGGRVRRFTAKYAATATDAANDVLFLAALPSNAVLHKMLAYWDDWGTTVLASFGVHNSRRNLVSADLWKATAILSTAETTGLDLAYGASGQNELEKGDKRLWERVGAAKDPSSLYYITMTLTTVSGITAGADLVVEGQYVVD